MYDFHGGAFLDATQHRPARRRRLRSDATTAARSCRSSYGRYFEAIPLNVAARYFGGEGILGPQQRPVTGTCANTNPYTWTGAGECRELRHAAQVRRATTTPADNPAGGYFCSTTARTTRCRPNLQGQYHNEIVATVEREVIEDLTVRLDYQHRWLGDDHRGRHRRPGAARSCWPTRATCRSRRSTNGDAPQRDMTAGGAGEAADRPEPTPRCRRCSRPPRPPRRSWRRCRAWPPRPSPSGPTTPSRCRSTSASRRTGWRARRTPTRA